MLEMVEMNTKEEKNGFNRKQHKSCVALCLQSSHVFVCMHSLLHTFVLQSVVSPVKGQATHNSYIAQMED